MQTYKLNSWNSNESKSGHYSEKNSNLVYNE